MQQATVDWLRRLESRCITCRKKMVLCCPGELGYVSASAIQATWPCLYNAVRSCSRPYSEPNSLIVPRAFTHSLYVSWLARWRKLDVRLGTNLSLNIWSYRQFEGN